MKRWFTKRAHVTFWCVLRTSPTPNGNYAIYDRTAYKPSVKVDHIPRIFYDWLEEMRKEIKLSNDGKSCVITNCGVVRT